jgi:hypothetical protein
LWPIEIRNAPNFEAHALKTNPLRSRQVSSDNARLDRNQMALVLFPVEALRSRFLSAATGAVPAIATRAPVLEIPA